MSSCIYTLCAQHSLQTRKKKLTEANAFLKPKMALPDTKNNTAILEIVKQLSYKKRKVYNCSYEKVK